MVRTSCLQKVLGLNLFDYSIVRSSFSVNDTGDTCLFLIHSNGYHCQCIKNKGRYEIPLPFRINGNRNETTQILAFKQADYAKC